MIVQTFPSQRKTILEKVFLPHVVKHTPNGPFLPDTSRPNEQDKRRADQFKITPEEFVRRDKIVRQVYLDTAMNWSISEVCKPSTDQAFQQYGRLEIKGIFKTYHDFPTLEAMEWPQDDKPFLFTVSTEKNPNQLLVVTAHFLKKIPLGGSC